MSNNDQNIITEYFDDKFAVLLENIETLVDKKLQPLADDVQEIKKDNKIIKAAVTDTSIQVQSHERQIAQLKPKAA